MTSVDIALAAGAILGECPLWSPADSRLYWVDIEGRNIHRFDPSTGENETRSLPTRPGSMVRTSTAGRFLVATETELVWFDWDSSALEPWLHLEPSGSGNRLNDGRTDPQGRYWVGSMYEDAAARQFTGHLHRIDSGGSVATLRSEIGVANGIAFDAERNRMYFADSLCDTVWRYRYDPESGRLHDEVPFIDFTLYDGAPDGACVDTEGCYWVAAVWGWSLMRFTPDGEHDRTITLPVEAPTMPAFGGDDMSTLFVTSISTAGSRQPSPADQHAGALVAVDTGVSGFVDVPFGG